MLKKYIFLLVIVLSTSVFAQYLPGSVMSNVKGYVPKPPITIFKSHFVGLMDKPVIDSTAINNWVSLENEKCAISNDGNYFVYCIRNQPLGNNTLVVQSVNGYWKKELIGVKDGFFSGNNIQFIYSDNQGLQFLELGSDVKYSIPNVISYQIPTSGKGEWLFYKLGNAAQELVAHNLLTGAKKRFINIENYSFDKDVSTLLLHKKINLNGRVTSTLELVSMPEAKVTSVWSSDDKYQLVNYKVHADYKQLALLLTNTSEHTGDTQSSIWYYRLGMDKPLRLIDNNTLGIDEGLMLTNSSSLLFTQDGRYLSFSLAESNLLSQNLEGVKVDVWTHKDSILQSTQLLEISRGNKDSYLAVIGLMNGEGIQERQVIRLQQAGERIYIAPSAISGDYCIMLEHKGGDRFWESEVVYKLVSLRDGRRQELLKTHKNESFWFSPGGQYLLHFDGKQYCSLDLTSGQKRGLSGNLPVSFAAESPFHNGFSNSAPVGLAGWVGNKSSVLVYDNYDIWQLDLSGKIAPINITAYYGHKNKLKIRLVEKEKVYAENDTVLASVFNPVNKYNGLYKVIVGRNKNLQTPVLSPGLIYYDVNITQGAANYFDPQGAMRPIKARMSNAWIVQRQSTEEASNYFITHDFKDYKSLTNLQPQRRYNWLTSELLQWSKPDGSTGQGVLYKPEDFDANKKYPVIIYYYEWLSGRLHQYPVVDFTKSTHINIPWFVSRGYLVFTPDMVYKQGKMVQSFCNTVVSGAQSLSCLPYVNGKKIGVSGFSWGGIQTNWLVTQSNIFAAAATGGGYANQISAALQVFGDNGNKKGNGLEAMETLWGGSLWEDQEFWLNINPILRADKITTPVLMMNNYRDWYWQQLVELYISLRRLNKKVWMLQYDEGGHGIWGPNGRDAKDFTVRSTQYFDHFLKEAPAPIWMTQGIPAKLKGMITGYAYDPSGNCGKDCKVCKRWNDKYKKDSAACWKEIGKRKVEEHWQ